MDAHTHTNAHTHTHTHTHAHTHTHTLTHSVQECDVHVGVEMAALQGAVTLDPVVYLDRVDSMWCDYCAQLLTIRQVCVVCECACV